MSQLTANAAIAAVLGLALAVLLFVPVAAVRYRRAGVLRKRELVLLVAAAVYFWSLWTYTLLPLPGPEIVCAGTQLTPLDSVRPIWRADLDGPLALLGSAAFLQVALNVLLFVPLGYFVRVVTRRGVGVAAAVGLVTSLAIETTQVTGVWGVFACAYRVFDVDDLLLNTLGAALGSLLCKPLVDDDPARPRRLPTRVAGGRRAAGVAADVVLVLLIGGAAAMAYRFAAVTDRVEVDARTQVAVQLGVPLAAQAVAVLVAGRTLGELTVSLRAVARRRWTTPLARVVKLAAGVGPVFVLLWWQGWWTLAVLAGFVLLSGLVAWRTEQHRGLSHLLAGMDLRVTGLGSAGAAPTGTATGEGSDEPLEHRQRGVLHHQ